MGQAAFKYDEFEDLDRVPIPEGGIATFLTARTGSWADEEDEIPKKGITNVVKIADKLAKYGRNEDEYIVHAAEGETVIPMEVFKQNPALKDKLFAEMRIMGIEPERYIVGNELNSINPVTGQPEFFLKKLFKGLKKVVKAILPVVAKIVLTPFVGPVAASAIVDGATAIIQGGSFKDGLKAAAIGGISSFAAGKLGDRFNWAKSTAGRMGAEAAINTTLSGGKPRDILKSAAIGAVTGKASDALGNYIRSRATDPDAITVDPDATDAVIDTDALQVEDVTTPEVTTPKVASETLTPIPETGTAAETLIQRTAGEGLGTEAAEGLGTEVAGGPGTTIPSSGALNVPQGSQTTGSGAPPPAGGQKVDIGGELSDFAGEQIRPIGETFREIFTGGGRGFQGRLEAFGDLFLPNYDRGELNDLLRDLKKQDPAAFDDYFGKNVTIDRAASTFLKENPVSFSRKFGPAGVALLSASALFPGDDPELTDLSTLPTGFDLIKANPERYRVFYGDDPIRMPTRYGVTRAAGFFEPTPIDTSLPPVGVAGGGEIMNFPRMNGPIEGPGTETSDDIPAMLSDGEFVFTAKAVRGAGKGSREDGMRNMYRMMRQFEAKV